MLLKKYPRSIDIWSLTSDTVAMFVCDTPERNLVLATYDRLSPLGEGQTIKCEHEQC